MMSKKTKIWLIVAASLTLIGALIFAGGMTGMSWDFTKLSTVKFETHSYVITEEYQNISMLSHTADIRFVPSENEKTTVVCYEQELVNHRVTAAGGTLSIEVRDERKWYQHIGIYTETPTITVAIPRGEYGMLSISSNTGSIEIPDAFTFTGIDISQTTGNVTNYASASGDVTIKTTTGNIHTQSISANSLFLSVTTGKIGLSDVTCTGNITLNASTGKTAANDIRCKSLISSGNTGDIALTNAIAAEQFSIERSTGDVKFDSCDAAELTVKTDTGNVTGSLLTDKVFLVQSDTGRINVPKSVTGGKCEITTDTGNIIITIK